MKILLLTESEYLYEYQLTALKEIVSGFHNVRFDLYPHPHCKSKHHSYQVLNTIDRRISNYPISSLKKTKYSDVELNICLIKNIPNLGDCENILLFTGTSDNTEIFESLKDFSVYTFQYSEQSVFTNCLANSPSYISIQVSQKGDIDFTEIFKLKLSPENGVYNSRDKFLFYSGLYLGRNFLKNETSENKRISSTSTRKRIFFPSFFIYYFKLILKFSIRKFSSFELNWKIELRKQEEVISLNQPKNTFWADPFLIKKNDTYYLFFEELVNKKGEISVITLDENLKFQSKVGAIKEDYHLSFPNVFEKNGQIYLLPESSAGSTLSVYESINFPTTWRKKIDLMPGKKLLDAVWIFHDNLYWLFANVINDFELGNNEHLHVFYSSDFFSTNWKPHPSNPVVADIEKSRNAGLIRNENGKLVRVSQNCKNIYGENLVYSEIIHLDINKYEEKTIRKEFPDREYFGTHTFNTVESITVVDFLEKERKAD